MDLVFGFDRPKSDSVIESAAKNLVWLGDGPSPDCRESLLTGRQFRRFLFIGLKFDLVQDRDDLFTQKLDGTHDILVGYVPVAANQNDVA
jgi:hypothetical protein